MFNGDWLVCILVLVPQTMAIYLYLDFLETNTNTINLKEEDPRFVQTMIDFVYNLKYDSTKHGLTSSMPFHIGAYQIADKYDVPNLKEYAKDIFGTLVMIFWDLDDFPAAIAEAYRTTPMSDKGLREPLVRSPPYTSANFLRRELLESV